MRMNIDETNPSAFANQLIALGGLIPICITYDKGTGF